MTPLDYALAVAGLSAIVVVHFFQGRRINILTLRTLSRLLEHEFKPVDKEYMLLGLYTGFRARYITHDRKIIETYVVLMPRYSILYMPIAKMLNKHDVLVLRVQTNKKLPKIVYKREDGKPRILKLILPEHELSTAQTRTSQAIRNIDKDVFLLYTKDNTITIAAYLDLTRLREQVKHIAKLLRNIEALA